MNNMFKAIAIIPARLESSRLPGKALLDICGLPMIVHVYKRCLLASTLDKVYVATDNIEIKLSEDSWNRIVKSRKVVEDLSLIHI